MQVYPARIFEGWTARLCLRLVQKFLLLSQSLPTTNSHHCQQKNCLPTGAQATDQHFSIPKQAHQRYNQMKQGKHALFIPSHPCAQSPQHEHAQQLESSDLCPWVALALLLPFASLLIQGIGASIQLHTLQGSVLSRCDVLVAQSLQWLFPEW